MCLHDALGDVRVSQDVAEVRQPQAEVLLGDARKVGGDGEGLLRTRHHVHDQPEHGVFPHAPK